MKDASAKLIEKAERAIRASRHLLDAGDCEFALGRAYYAMFYVAEAILNERGMRFRKHGGVHSALGEHLVKKGELDPKYHHWLLLTFDQRITADYGIDPDIVREDVEEAIAHAREFLEEGRRILGLPPAGEESGPGPGDRS